MKVKPMRYYMPPGYPQKEAFLANPDGMGQIPVRWSKNGVVMTALGMTLVLSACSSSGADGGMVAPLFIHGEGSGSFGCVAVTSPYFFSEEEAFEIIRSEAEEYGSLAFDGEESSTLENVKIPQTSLMDSGTKLFSSYRRGNLELDGVDKESKIAFEFVSSGDVGEWKKEDGGYSTVYTYDMQTAAKNLQKGLKRHKGDLHVGIFYDPYDFSALQEEYEVIDRRYDGPDRDWEAVQEEKNEAAKALSEENLRMQVRDFIDWLKGQGVI